MEIITLDIEQTRPATYNPRKDLQPSDPEYQKLKKSILAFDMVEPLIWNKRSGNLVGGHQRLKILKELGRSHIDVSVVDLDDAKEKALNIALNKISGEWDLPGLKDLLQELDTGDFDMEITGFDDKEIEDLINQLYTPGEGLTDDDAIPEATESICRRGDLWKLGNHRLLCGDATIKKDVDKLMGGEKADMVFTDPPYGVAVNQGTKADLKARHRRLDGKKVENDDLIGDNLKAFLSVTFRNYSDNLKDGGSLYICHAESLGMDVIFRSAFMEAGFKPAEIIIWVKDQFVFGRQDYHWRHEPIIYGWKQGDGHYFIDDHTQDTVWEFARPKRSESHPTMKPVALCERAIANSSKVNNLVLDLFGGSGSTLIACEKLDRRCYMMEIDTHYCDVIIKRWEDYTDLKAVKL